MRTLTYHVAVSLDGRIAAADGDTSAFPVEGDHVDMLIAELPETLPGAFLAHLGVQPVMATYDTVVMGWDTYAVGLALGVADPYPHLRQYVCSRRHRPVAGAGDVVVTDEDPRTLVRRLKAEASAGSAGAGIWLCGGGQLAAALVDEIDRIVLKVNPILLPGGIPLFADGCGGAGSFRLASTRPFTSGVVVNTYERAGGSGASP